MRLGGAAGAQGGLLRVAAVRALSVATPDTLTRRKQGTLVQQEVSREPATHGGRMETRDSGPPSAGVPESRRNNAGPLL